MSSRPTLPPNSWRDLLALALAEDIGTGDLTSEVCVDEDRLGQARLEAREALVVCGLEVARSVFRAVDSRMEFQIEGDLEDGEPVAPGRVLARIRGPYRSILTAERTALNFVGRLCGIATQTARLASLIANSGTDLVDTRKTTPGWRALEKYAVATGGGVNHRVGLYDAILIKDNHIAAAGTLDEAVSRALRDAPDGISVQVEVESMEMVERAIELGARFLLLDNMSPQQIQEVVSRYADVAVLEASGGINASNLADYAATGVARISMGALTHSVASADVALEIDLLPTPENAR